MRGVSPYRLTVEDLPELDNKTREGLQPLLNALNVTLGQVVQALQVQPSGRLFDLDVTADDVGGVEVALTMPRPTSVTVEQLRRFDGQSISTAYGMSWIAIAEGIRVTLVGLMPDVRYIIRLGLK